jgi:hypothetical protein
MTLSRARLRYMEMYVFFHYEVTPTQDVADRFVLKTLAALSDAERQEFTRIVAREYEAFGGKLSPNTRLLLARSLLILQKAGYC